MSKHTPGPWQYSFEGGTVAFILESDGATVAKISVTENSTAHSTLAANARLIAAAPELLAALKDCVFWYANRDDELWPFEKQPPEIQRAMAAIAKAEGRAA